MRGSGEEATRPVPRVVETTTNRDEEDSDAEPIVAAEVIAPSPRTLPAATSRFASEACGKELLHKRSPQLHGREHAHGDDRLPHGSGRRAHVCCPEASRARHEPEEVAAGIGRHNRRRRHGESKWKCDLCGKRYAADYDWEAHAMVCGVGNNKQAPAPP